MSGMWDQQQGMKTQPPPIKKPPPATPPPPTPPPQKKGVKITLKEFAETTTAHGIGRVASSTQLWLRVFWAVIFLTAFGVFIWQSVFLFIRFFDNPVTVDVKVVYEEVSFPAVSICNLNALRASQLPLGGPDLKKQIDAIGDLLEEQLSGVNSTEQAKRRRRRALRFEAGKRGMTLDEMINILDDSHDRLRVRREAGGNETTVQETPDSSTQPISTQPDTAAPQTAAPTTCTCPSGGACACQNGGICTGTGASAQCVCPSGYSGDYCALVNPCASSPCKNGATCTDLTDTTFSCACASGYSGSSCDSGGSSSGGSSGDGQYDPADVFFKPDVDTDGMPWFKQDDQPDVRVQSAKTMSRILRDIPISVRQKMGHRVDDMVQECNWDGKLCTPLNFTGFLNRFYGNCYTFNSGYNSDIVTSTKPGSLYGLTLTLFLQQNEYLQALSPSAGVRVLIHNQNQQPFPEDEAIDLTPGHKTSITLRLRKQSKLPAPYSNCTDGTKETLMYKKDYSVGACRRSCLQMLKHDNCSCADAELPVPQGWDLCKSEDEILCSEAMDTAVETGKHNCKCAELCDENVYITSIATSEWPGEAFEETIVTQFSARDKAMADLLKKDGEIRKNFLKFEIGYEEIRYDEMSEQPAYGVENLLADIGGQLGLWIGVSVLTLVEFVQLIITLIQVGLNRNKVQQQQQQQQQQAQQQQQQMQNNYSDYPPPPKQY